MEFDEKEFFRQATLLICGSLDVETFLWESFSYIRGHVPADTVYLGHFDPENNEHRILAKASAARGERLDIRLPLPPEIRSYIQRPDTQTRAIGRASSHPTARPWIARGMLDNDSSLLVLRLIVGGLMVGGLVFTAKKSDQFTSEHAQIVHLLREPYSIALSNYIRHHELLQLKELLAEDNQFLRSELKLAGNEEIIGAEGGLSGVMELVRQVAPLPSPVILMGETGTGKEVIAGAVHNLSPRKDGPFIKVNCGAIPENLMDSELFGHEKGAFTGALSQKKGRFERADKGTIFLDEVGELPADAQVRLLRVLQEKEIERVGGNGPVKVDIRVIAATNRDVKTMVREGTFREDLLFRLNVFPIKIPPLRDRLEDMTALIIHFFSKKSAEMGLAAVPSLRPDTTHRLKQYSWPGNVRELGNSIEHALILSKGDSLSFNEILAQCNTTDTTVTAIGSQALEVPVCGKDETLLTLDECVAAHIRKTLKLTGGKVGGRHGAAELLDINASTIRKKMRKLGIPFGRNTNY